MPRRWYLRTDASDATGFTTGGYKSYALDQAINNQSPSVVKPVNEYGGALTPRVLSPERGGLADGASLSVDPPDTGSLDDTNENWRGFLTHFITPPLAAQRLRAGFTKLAFKSIHASDTSTLTGEFSVYVVDSSGAVVSFLFDRDKIATALFVDDPTVAGVVHRIGLRSLGAQIPTNGRLVIEPWTRQTVTDAAGTEGVGAEFFLNGADESFGSTVGGAGEYDTDSVASWVEFSQDVLLADDEPVFSARIDPLVGARHHKVWSTDVIDHGDASEQRVRL